MSVGLAILLGLLLVLLALAARRGDGVLGRGLQRAIEQFAHLAPRLLGAMLAAGFLAPMLPREHVASLLGAEAGVQAVLVASLAGLLVPAGPVVAFPIAAVFAQSGASTPALVAFLTAWTLYAAHRILLYEIPLVGVSFLRLRALSVALLPMLAGGIALFAGWCATLVAARPI